MILRHGKFKFFAKVPQLVRADQGSFLRALSIYPKLNVMIKS